MSARGRTPVARVLSLFLYLVGVFMRKGAAQRRQLVLFAASAVLLLCGCAGRAGRGAFTRDSTAQAITVEALGFATFEQGKPIEEVHREALLDARRNALLQAQVVVESETLVRDLRLQETLVRSRTAGYVEEMHVLEAGRMSGPDASIYRVRLRAVIRSLPAFAAGLAGPDRWRPALVLRARSNLSPDEHSAVLSSLAEGLRRCGILIARPEDEGAALVAELLIAAASAAEREWLKVEWRIRPDKTGPIPKGTTPVAQGHWRITERPRPDSAWWQRVAAAIAQDAIRLWSTPRQTVVRVLGTDERQAEKIARAFGRAAGSRVERPEDSSQVVVILSIAGDPLARLGRLLAEAGLSEKAVPVEVSLTRVTYKLVPAADAESDSASGSE